MILDIFQNKKNGLERDFSNDRYLIFLNQSSGILKKNIEKKIENYFNSKNIFFSIIKQNPRELDIKKIVETGNFNRILCGGGDGTIRSICEICLQNKINLPIGILPLGSGNILAISFGMPLNLEKALDFILEKNSRKIDVGILNSKHIFLIGISFGDLSDIILNAKRNEKMKIGFFAYIKSFFAFKKKMSQYDFEIKGEEIGIHFRKCNSILILNHIDIFGSSKIRNINGFDGKMDVFFLKNHNLFGFGRILFDFYLNKKSQYFDHFKADKISIKNEFIKGSIKLDGDKIQENYSDYFVEIMPSAADFIF